MHDQLTPWHSSDITRYSAELLNYSNECQNLMSSGNERNANVFSHSDVNTSVPDKKSIMMYVMCLFQSLPHSEMDLSHLDISVHSDSGSIASPGAEVNVVNFILADGYLY